MIENILTACLVMGALALVFGIMLTVANKIFYVYKDPLIDEVREVLPGANCGGCGKAGCDAVADAIVKGEAPINICPVGGNDVAQKIAQIMGIEAADLEPQVAFVRCSGGREVTKLKYEYYGIEDCKAANAVQNGYKMCEFGCLGFGECVKACKFDAIRINESGIAEVDPSKCTGCGSCAKACPKQIIGLKPKKSKVFLACSSQFKGKTVKNNCFNGCITCGLCEKNCPFEAIRINKDNNLPEIDYHKCRGCMVCVEKCPQHVLKSYLNVRLKPVINDEKCIGCGKCRKNCPKEAIQGEIKQTHTIDYEKCIGCGICAEKCPKSAIEMVEYKK